MKIEERIENLQREIVEQSERINALVVLRSKYPDLKEHTDRWGNVRLSTKSANKQTTDVEIAHNCGCCSDSPLEVWPYFEENGTRIFSYPIPFTVGVGCYGGGDQPYPDWEEELKRFEIPEQVINIVKKYFEDNKPSEEDDEDMEDIQ